MTKKEQNMLWSYEHAKCENIMQAYNRPSRRKIEAFDDCRRKENELNGYGGRITGASSHFFSYAFKYEKNGKKFLYYITYANDYSFEIA